MPATVKDAYRLLHNGSLALSRLEDSGIRVDLAYLHEQREACDRHAKELEAELKNDRFYRKTWLPLYGEGARLGNRTQLGRILFEQLKYPCYLLTDKGGYSTEERAMGHIDHPFVKKYLEWARQRKLKSTYLDNLLREQVRGYFHPNFNLHTVSTFRSSSGRDPDEVRSGRSLNFQNLPIRNSVMAEIIRRCFIPRKGRRLVEIDFSQLEVRIAACYNKDPVLIGYIKDKRKDMHRDTAMELFLLSEEEAKGEPRFHAKNQFVFAQFYGSYYIDCAKALWQQIQQGMKTPSGALVKDHLKQHGITRLGACNPDERPQSGTFEGLCYKVEDAFWNQRFKIYSRWKQEWYEAYQRRGWFTLATGVKIEGDYRRNAVINYPVQGAAFHCLLWSLTELQNWLDKYQMESRIVGQIHDSLLLDVAEDELDDVLSTADWIMTEWIRRKWDWIIVPLEVEIEATPIGGSWHEKTKNWRAA